MSEFVVMSDTDWARAHQVPDNEVPGVAASSQVMTATGDAAVVLGEVEVYSTGVRFTVATLLRRADVAWDPATEWDRFEDLLLGVELPDGRRIVGESRHGGFKAGDDRYALVQQGGSGGGRRADHRWLLTPLPPPGDLVVLVAHPTAGLEEARVVVPAAAMAAAREAVVTLWPWEPDAELAGWAPRQRPVPEGGWFAQALGEPPA